MQSERPKPTLSVRPRNIKKNKKINFHKIKKDVGFDLRTRILTEAGSNQGREEGGG